VRLDGNQLTGAPAEEFAAVEKVFEFGFEKIWWSQLRKRNVSR